jgi:DNA-directed RNA polymerase sigma subunit (sigma70/sigma32)
MGIAARTVAPYAAPVEPALDPVLAALDDLRLALAVNVQVGTEVLERIDVLVAERAAGRPWSDIVPTEDKPLVVELLSANLDRLSSAGSRLRRAQAKALHDEGLTMEQIAALFGVTRQRVSALLKERPSRT